MHGVREYNGLHEFRTEIRKEYKTIKRLLHTTIQATPDVIQRLETIQKRLAHVPDVAERDKRNDELTARCAYLQATNDKLATDLQTTRAQYQEEHTEILAEREHWRTAHTTLEHTRKELSDMSLTCARQVSELTTVRAALNDTCQKMRTLETESTKHITYIGQLEGIRQTYSKMAQQHEGVKNALEAKTEEVNVYRDRQRWYQHFVGDIDVNCLRSSVDVGRTQERCLYNVLCSLFGNSVHEIKWCGQTDIHTGDIHVTPLAGGHMAIFDMKSHHPDSRGKVYTDGSTRHVIDQRSRDKLVRDVQQTPQCVAGVMVVLPQHHIPNITWDTNGVAVDPQHEHILYCRMHTKALQKTMMRVVQLVVAATMRNSIEQERQDLHALVSSIDARSYHVYTNVQHCLSVYYQERTTHTTEALRLGVVLHTPKPSKMTKRRIPI